MDGSVVTVAGPVERASLCGSAIRKIMGSEDDGAARGNEFPARLHVLMATAAPLAVVIRHGPSKQASALVWDRRTDTFTLGQWLKGRIYSTRSDISFDGKYWIYFTLNGKWKSETRGSYTVLARVPYLRALHLWPQGDTWGGGGLFVARDRFTAFHGGVSLITAPTAVLKGEVLDQPWYTGSIYASRLRRGGWSASTRAEPHERHTIHTFERPVGHGWLLRKLLHSTSRRRLPGKGIPYEEHALVHPASQRVDVYSDWEWADLDGERLVWADKGRLYAGRVGKEGLLEPQQLHDFNGMKFEAIRAPY